MKTAIFGGTFDPPHIEHINLVSHVIGEFNLDRCVVLPCGNPPHKQGSFVSDAEDRLNMTRLCFENVKKVVIDDYEIAKNGPSYTAETLEHFYEGEKLLFIMGADSLTSIDSWHKHEKIFPLADIIVVGRAGEEKESEHPYIDSSFCGRDISSTRIRVMQEFGIPSGLVTDKVQRYMDEHVLYRNFSKYVSAVRERISRERYLHTMYTVLAAVNLNAHFKLNIPYERLFIACALHDIAKNSTVEDAIALGVTSSDVLNASENVRHAYVGAALCRKLFPELDDEILDAIYYHSTFCPHMTPLQKVTAISDSIEETRVFPDVEEIRNKVFEDLDGGIDFYLKHMLKHLQKKGVFIEENTLIASKYFSEVTNGK